MQHWYNLSDGAMEDALYEIASMHIIDTHNKYQCHIVTMLLRRWDPHYILLPNFETEMLELCP